MIVADEWASWRGPGAVCFGDSGPPQFVYDASNRSHDDRAVAVASDGGDVCFSRDDRARVDTLAAREGATNYCTNDPQTVSERPLLGAVAAGSRLVGICRMHNQVQRSAVPKSNACEVTHIARG